MLWYVLKLITNQFLKHVFNVTFFFKYWLEIPSNFMGENMNCNQPGFVNGKSTLSSVLESIYIIREYSIEGDNADIIFGF